MCLHHLEDLADSRMVRAKKNYNLHQARKKAIDKADEIVCTYVLKTEKISQFFLRAFEYSMNETKLAIFFGI